MPEGLIHCVVGTRPELIKMAPVVRALQRRQIPVACVHTGQHTELARQAFADVGLQADICLLPDRTDRRVSALFGTLYDNLRHEFQRQTPSVVLVHGDTASAWAASMAAFYEGIPVGHVEAGLRCPTLTEPFPEEAHRRLIGRLAQWHFAPTARARSHLLRERTIGDILVTGNTAIDSIRELTEHWLQTPHSPATELMQAWANSEHTSPQPFRLLLTVHRRENWGEPIDRLILEVAQWLSQSRHHHLIWPLHANPVLQKRICSALEREVAAEYRGQIHLLPALSYPDMVWALQHCTALATDSGGLQEEASAFFKPALILRNSTERPEALEAGYAHLIGCGQGRLVAALHTIGSGLWPHMPASQSNQRWPFGDGHAAERIAQHLLDALSNPSVFPNATT